MTNKMREEVNNWARKQKVMPEMIIANYIEKGETMWAAMNEEYLQKALKEYDSQPEQAGTIRIMTTDFVECITRACWELYKLGETQRELKIEIIRRYLV